MIAVHNIPEGLAMAVPMKASGMRVKNNFLYSGCGHTHGNGCLNRSTAGGDFTTAYCNLP